MTVEDSGPPAGWYPDPAGQRQWRVWNGHSWADATKSFGDDPHSAAATVPAVRAHDALVRYGVMSYFAGAGLLIDAIHHRPAPFSNSTPGSFLIMSIFGAALFLVGHLCYARALTTLLDGRQPIVVIPILNLLAWARYVFLRGSYSFPVLWRTSGTRTDAVSGAGTTQLFLVLFLVGYAFSPLPSNAWLSVGSHLLPAFVAYVNLRWATQLRHDLAGA